MIGYIEVKYGQSYKILALQSKYPTAEALLNKSGPVHRFNYSAFSENCVSRYYGGPGMPLLVCLCTFENNMER